MLASRRDHATKGDRQRRYRRGRRGEWLAIAMLTAKGYRILGRRVETASGEIDLIALRRERLAFIEVKRRTTRAAAEASITPRQRQRIHRAADLWLSRHPELQRLELGFDLVFVLPWRWPRHLVNAL